jgi:hypothetical protein
MAEAAPRSLKLFAVHSQMIWDVIARFAEIH